MKTKTQKNEKQLLHENTKAIDQARAEATHRATSLNMISEVFLFESQNEFESRTHDINLMVKNAMLSQPELKKLSETVLIESIRVPDFIKEARSTVEYLISKFGSGIFTHLSFISLSGRWEPDTDALQVFAEANRIYARGEKQIAFYNATVTWCELLNANELGFGTYEKGDFDHIFIDWSLAENKWIPNVKYISSL